jgi:YecR-like lipoprotein/Prokaryotic membrane lipoprotein lipid attachment site
MRRSLLALLIVTGLAGCATQKEWVATGGSRADGTVRLSFEVAQFEAPQTNEQQGLTVARARCVAWGYQDAEAFGGVQRTCNERNSYGCTSWLITKEYQCLGKGDVR